MKNESAGERLVSMFTRRESQKETLGKKHTSNVASPKLQTSKPKPQNQPTSHQELLADAVIKAARKELSNAANADDQDISEIKIAAAIDTVCERTGTPLDDITRSNIIIHLKSDLFGWGLLQPLIDDPQVTDIHCYDYRTVVLQRGKESETTGIRWPSPEAYQTYLDRIVLRLGKSLSTQQHTVDGAFPDGKRICAIHSSVCGSRGPLLTVRVPRIRDAYIESLVDLGVCPPLIVDYLGALISTCEHTFIMAGETGTGKTTMLRSFGSRFKATESVIGVEDTAELNYQHPYYRSLVSRGANSEGVGEVSLQEHIKSTLRLCPTRVILGEMRTPEAAESFLEAAQTGHAGLSTIHARNARETLTRLESLLGRAQRGVSMDIIRQQIALALDVVCWCVREKTTGKIRLAEVIEVGNFVEGQIQVRPMFKMIQGGENPIWEVQSFSSNHDNILKERGVHLSETARYLELHQEPEPQLVGNE